MPIQPEKVEACLVGKPLAKYSLYDLKSDQCCAIGQLARCRNVSPEDLRTLDREGAMKVSTEGYYDFIYRRLQEALSYYGISNGKQVQRIIAVNDSDEYYDAEQVAAVIELTRELADEEAPVS